MEARPQWVIIFTCKTIISSFKLYGVLIWSTFCPQMSSYLKVPGNLQKHCQMATYKMAGGISRKLAALAVNITMQIDGKKWGLGGVGNKVIHAK